MTETNQLQEMVKRHCFNCGKEFEIQGVGFVKCPGCHSTHFVFENSLPLNKNEPRELLMMLY